MLKELKLKRAQVKMKFWYYTCLYIRGKEGNSARWYVAYQKWHKWSVRCANLLFGDTDWYTPMEE